MNVPTKTEQGEESGASPHPAASLPWFLNPALLKRVASVGYPSGSAGFPLSYYHLVGTYYVLSSYVTSLAFLTILCHRCYDFCYFMVGETEAQRS